MEIDLTTGQAAPVLQDLALIMELIQPDEAPLSKPTALTLPIVITSTPVPVITENDSKSGELDFAMLGDVSGKKEEVEDETKGVADEPKGEAQEVKAKAKDEVKDEVKEEINAGPEEVPVKATVHEEVPDAAESDSESETESTSSSTTESDSDDAPPITSKSRPTRNASDVDDDDEAGPVNPTLFATKNEIIVPEVQMPDIKEVGPDETIENIGEIMNIVDSVVVVKGRINSAHQVIDSGSLLVLDDRKVLGLVFETFGAVTQPLYSIRFPSASSIDKERVHISRPVFHLPQRSNYVFTRHLLLLKGSDASNLHDEEPSDSEVEFSDDEKEAAHKRSLKRARRDRGRRDVEGELPDAPSELDYGDIPMDGSLSVDPRAGRAPPVRYDDEDFAMEEASAVSSRPVSPVEQRGQDHYSSRGRGEHSDRGGGRGRGRGRGRDGQQRGRGRGRHNDRGRGGPRGGHSYPSQERYDSRPSGPSIYERDDGHYPSQPQHPHRALSPTSEAIARVTGNWAPPHASADQYDRNQYEDYHRPAPHYDQHYDPRTPAMQAPAQYPTPHINPRFAFGGQGFQPGFYPQFMPNPAMAMYGMGGAPQGYHNGMASMPPPSQGSSSQPYQYPPYDPSQSRDPRYDYRY